MNVAFSIPWTIRVLLLAFVLWSRGTAATAQEVSASVEAVPVNTVLYGPETNLERGEVDMLRRARVSLDVAMYSFTDREVAETLAMLARRGVHVRVYRDRRESIQEEEHGASTTALLVAAGVEVRVKASSDLMHLKCYVLDGVLLRTRSANWSSKGLKRQDNDVRYETDPLLAQIFEKRFAVLWDRASNLVPVAVR